MSSGRETFILRPQGKPPSTIGADDGPVLAGQTDVQPPPGNRPTRSTRERLSAWRPNWGFWILVIVLVALWQYIGSRKSAQVYIVSPTMIISQFGTLWHTGLPKDLTTSGEELALGFLAGACVGIVAGILGGNWRTFNKSLTPIVSALYAIPVLALAPIFILIFGIGIESKVVVVGLETFFPVPYFRR